MKKNKVSVFFGRFQPAHQGHIHVIKHALEHTDRIIIVIGSKDEHQSFHNPFTPEYVQLFLSTLIIESGLDILKVKFLHIKDYTYNDNKWETEARSLIKSNIDNEIVYLTGYQKDSSSYYLSMFPEWRELPYRTFYHNLSSTDIRNSIIDNTFNLKYSDEVSSLFVDNLGAIKNKLEDMPLFEDGIELVTNAVIISSGHVLLRNEAMKYSLPYGYINKDESVINATLRMINETTNIRLTDNILTARIKDNDVFDSPFRVEHKRTISLCTLFKLNNNVKLPRISNEYSWISLDEITRQSLKNDYYHIIKYYIGY